MRNHRYGLLRMPGICTLVFLWSVSLFSLACEDEGGGVYACNYESRYTGCGGVGWSDWETECYEFNIDDYLEDWTPERVCNKFTGTDTECGGGCCIEVQYQNTELSSGSCP